MYALVMEASVHIRLALLWIKEARICSPIAEIKLFPLNWYAFSMLLSTIEQFYDYCNTNRLAFSSDPLVFEALSQAIFHLYLLRKNESWSIWWCRLDRSLSVVDIKVDSQELEKFSTLNRFAKFHFKAHTDPASSTVQKTTPQRYIRASPMPVIIPEEEKCISLWS